MEKMEGRNGFYVFPDKIGHVALIESMGSDLSIVRNARVSYDAEWRTGQDAGKDAKLIQYLVKNNHTSPLEAVQFTFEVKAPMFVARQWMRHRTFSFSEVSARYSALPEEFYVPSPALITGQSATNKQMRTDEQHPDAEFWGSVMFETNTFSFKMYNDMIAEGIPRELARSVLPLATYTHFFCTVDLNNLAKFIALRSHSHAQYEIRVYSDAILKIVEDVCPIAIAALRQKLDIQTNE